LVKFPIEYRDWKSEIVRRMMMHPITGVEETSAEQLQSCEKRMKTKAF
jgi:hypothetical protein